MRWTQKQLLGSSVSSLVALAAVFSSPAFAAPNRAECLRSRSTELAALASCGHEGSIQNCLSHMTVDSSSSSPCPRAALEKCYVDAGCTAEEAAIEAAWTLKRCDERAGADDMADLRRRQKTNSDADNKDNKPKGGQQKTAPADPQPATPEAAAEPTPAAAAAPTPADPAQTTQQAPQTQVVVVTASGTTFTGAVTTPLVCFTNTTSSVQVCPTQTTGSESGKTLPCFSAETVFPTCAAGLLCRTDAIGHPTCMKINNDFGAAGVIISLFFAVSMTVAIFATCFYCCRERRVQARLTKAAEAAAIARQAAIDKKRPSVNVRSVSAQSGVSDSAPLMQHGAPGGGPVYMAGQPHGMDPFADQHQMR